MKTRSTSGGLAALLMVTAGLAEPAAAQVDSRARAREVLSDDAFARLEMIAETAEAEGIPVEPLFDKALEGAAKGVPADRILPAVAAHADRLRTARGLLGGEVGPPVIVAGADALLKGVPSESLRRLGPSERTPVALLVLGDLIQEGVPADEALTVVREALGRGTGDQTMLDMRPTIQRLLREGRSPRDAADALRRALRDGRPVQGIGRDGGGLGVPAPPGSEPLTRERRDRAAGGLG